MVPAGRSPADSLGAPRPGGAPGAVRPPARNSTDTMTTRVARRLMMASSPGERDHLGSIRSPQRILPGRWAQSALLEVSQALGPAPLIHLAEGEDRQTQGEEVQAETEQERRKRQGAAP